MGISNVSSYILKTIFQGRLGFRVLETLRLALRKQKCLKGEEKLIAKKTENAIEKLRKKYPNGLHFVVGDTHGEYPTLMALMDKIKVDIDKDHVFFVGDYNKGGNTHALLEYLGKYFQADFNVPGFHLIRGNHERELSPMYELKNLPDIIVIKRKEMSYYIVHAGMVQEVFELITKDIESAAIDSIFLYRLEESTVQYDAPFRQIMWSQHGLYSQHSKCHKWPSKEALCKNKACIIHGHTPYGFLLKKGSEYGDVNCLLKPQHIWFSEDLQSFNIDSNIKGRYEGGLYRGLSCLCLEVLEEIARLKDGHLSVKEVQNAQELFFSEEYSLKGYPNVEGNIERIIQSELQMKTIGMTSNGTAYFF